MKKKLSMTVVGLFLLAETSVPQTLPAALSALVEAERAFAAMSLARGIKPAFVANFADDAIIFRPGPINGKEFWSKREPTKATLEWRPVFADIAASGELGYTIGPSVFTPSPDLDQPPGYGHFVSLWRKQAPGVWKVVLDAGISHPYPARDTDLVVSPRANLQPIQPHPNENTPVLLQLERLFSTLSSKKGSATAYSRYLATDARVLRMGHLPAVGFDSCLALVRSLNDILTWIPIASHVADAFDLGYTYGTYQSIRESGHYVHIWRKQENGALKVVLDILLPSSPE